MDTDMITTGAVIDAAMPSYEDSSILDLLQEQAGQSTGEEKTAYVNSYISARKGDKECIYSLETPEQPFQITLRCWKSTDLKNVPNREDLHTYVTATLHIAATSKLHKILNQFFLIAARKCVKRW
jgi:hypothetical protein